MRGVADGLNLGFLAFFTFGCSHGSEMQEDISGEVVNSLSTEGGEEAEKAGGGGWKEERERGRDSTRKD